MKKFCILLVLLLLTGAAVQAQQQQFFPNIATRGQTTRFIVTGTPGSFTTVTGFLLGQWNQFYYNPSYVGNVPYTVHPQYAETEISVPSNAVLGTYDFVRWGWGFEWPYQTTVEVVAAGAGTGRISGQLTRDSSTVCSSGQPFADQVIEVLPGPFYLLTDSLGNYDGWLPLGNYTVNLRTTPQFHTLLCPGTNGYNVSLVAPGQQVTGQDFYLQQHPNYVDLAATPICNAHRPGFTTTNYVIVENFGSQAASNVEVVLAMSPIVSYLPGSAIPAAVYGNDTLTWNLGTVPGNSRTTLYYQVVTPNTAFGLLFTYRATVTTTNQDIIPQNNTNTWSVQVTGSYDPNDKQVWTQDNVNADGPINPGDSLLRYLVRFQNTGTDTAFTVFIRDTLDADLDPTSLQVKSASHTYGLNITNNNELEFLFPNILLPDSNVNEPGSHGHIEFTLKRNPGLPIGTEIDNTAHIYFDFNAPVVTNTVTSKICPEVNLDFSTSTNLLDLSLSNTSTGSIGSILWDFGDGNTSTAFAPSHTYAQPGGYPVCLTVTDTCGTRTLCKYVVAICEGPLTTFSATGNQGTFNFQGGSSSPNATWAWDFGDGSSSTLQSPTHFYPTAGAYQVCLTTTDTCTSTTFCDTIFSIGCAAPMAAFSNNPTGLQVQFTDQTSNPNIVSWLWTFGDGNSATTQNASHTYPSFGSYNACLVVTNDCGALDTTCQSITLVGRADPDALRVELYPNPNAGTFNLSAILAKAGEMQVRVSDLTGRVLYQSDWGMVPQKVNRRLDLGNLASGSYILQLEVNGARVNKLFSIW